jgi:hypothetical protein
MKRKMPRFLWEFLALLLIAAVGWGFWAWNQHRWNQRLEEQGATLGAELDQLRTESAQLERRLGEEEAVAVAQAFASGVHAAVLADRTEALGAAVDQLLLVPGVVFVHLLGAEGEVLATSDRKLAATGDPGPRASWALEATGGHAVRDGLTAGSTEVAVPIRGVAGPKAVLWLAYDAGREDAMSAPADGGPEAEAADPAAPPPPADL